MNHYRQSVIGRYVTRDVIVTSGHVLLVTAVMLMTSSSAAGEDRDCVGQSFTASTTCSLSLSLSLCMC